VCALATTAGCGAKGSSGSAGSDADTLTLGASLSLTGALAREGQLTKEGYQLCEQKVNAQGGVDVDGTKKKLVIKYQDDTSQPDTAAQLVDQFNDKGVKLLLSSYGSANTEAQAAVVERNGQVMVDSAGADNAIFEQGYKRTFAVLSPATEYAASIVSCSRAASPARSAVSVAVRRCSSSGRSPRTWACIRT
jgi:branched-chain amino acid transport system substrate-binding protein